MNKLRSMLFIPGNNPGMLTSADNLDSDAIIIDLEDAVSIKEKDSARDLVKSALETISYENTLLTVRVNPVDSIFFKEDMHMILKSPVNNIILPKASVESVSEFLKFLSDYEISQSRKEDIRLFLLVESAMGISFLEETIKLSDKIEGLLLGGEDFSLDMGVKRRSDSKELLYARYKIATLARAFNLNAIDTPFTDIDNIIGLKEDIENVKMMGFNGKLIVGPRQVDIVNKSFSPSLDEIDQAILIKNLAEENEKNGRGVFSFKGKMVDKPVIDRAYKLIEDAKNWGIIWKTS